MDSRCIYWLDEGTCVWVQTPGREQHSSLCWSTKMTPPFHIKSVYRLSVCVKVCVWVQASGLKGVMAVRVDGAQSHMYMCWLTEGWSSALNRDICSQWSDIRCFPSQLNYSLIHQRERERQTTVEGGREGGCETERGRQDASRETVWHSVRQKDSSWVEVTDMVRIYNLISVETLWLTASSCQPL